MMQEVDTRVRSVKSAQRIRRGFAQCTELGNAKLVVETLMLISRATT
jgi:hypothetical protein